MKTSQIFESTSIVAAVVCAFIIEHTALSNYSTYLLALLIIFSAIYISMKKRSKSASDLFSFNPVQLFGIITVILLIIGLTQGLLSPLFFFIYFLLFLLAFLNEPISIWVFAMAVILYFIPQASANPTVETFIKLGSILLIAPIAYFIGREFERRQLFGSKIESKTDEIIKEATLLKEDVVNNNPDEKEALDEIIEEAQSLQEDAKE